MKPEIEMLTKLGSDAVQAAITDYTRWLLVSACAWMAFGVLLIAIGCWLWKKADDADDYMDRAVVRVLALVLGLVGALTFPVNIPDVASPRAYAIHQLITDARGK